MFSKKQKTEKKTNDEKIKRSLAKTISWRIVGTADTVIISWLLTGALTLALSIGAIELVSKMILYFFMKGHGIKLNGENDELRTRKIKRRVS